MQITALSIQNWRSFGPRQTIRLGDLSLLVGPNNAGKSGCLSALDALRYWAQGQNVYVHARDYQALRLQGEGPAELGVDFSTKAGSARFRLNVDRVRHETRARLAIGGSTTEVSTLRGGFERTAFSDDIDELDHRLREFQVWRPNVQAFGSPVPLHRADRLSVEGANAASLLDSFDPRSSEFDSLQDDVRRCIPELERIVSLPTEHQGMKEIILVERGGVQVPARLASEGTKIVLFVLLLLHGRNRPRFLALEEIEHGLHPRRIRDVIDALRTLCRTPERPQVILTSHSPLVLEAFRDELEKVTVFERADGGTTVCTSLADRVKALGDDASEAPLGDLWYSGILGGVPQS